MRIVPGLIALALTCATAPCWAQMNSVLVGTIPFEFTVNNLTLPAGEYSAREIAPRTYAIGNIAGDLRVLSLAYPLAVDETPQAKLVFRKYGDKYFLAEAWRPFERQVMAFGKCRKEKELVTSRVVSGLRVEKIVVLARVR